MTQEELQQQLETVNEKFEPDTTTEDLRHKIQTIRSQRFLKVWHDHSTIAGHGHLLVLVSCMYDPAIYLTQAEVEQKGLHIDVETLVPTQHHSFRIQYQTLVATTVSTSAQQICLTDLRTKLLS